MREIVRRVLAVLAGAVVGVAVVSLGDDLAGQTWSPPPGADLSGVEGLRTAMDAMPSRTLIVLLLGWAAAAAAGSFVATRLSPGRIRLCGLIVTGLLLVATVMNLMSIPHPAWVWAGALILIPAAGWLAARAAARVGPGEVQERMG